MIAASTMISAQEIELKNKQVLLNNNIFLNYKKVNVLAYSFYSLNGDEILFFKIKKKRDSRS